MNQIYGYVRVSSKDQNEDRQLIVMREKNVPENHIFIDKLSGKDFNRPSYRELLNALDADDLLFLKSIDRLGRNYAEILEQWRILTKVKKVDICVIDMPLLDTRQGKDLMGTFLSDLVLQILSFVAENERKMIKQRQAEGIAAAKARGVRFGRARMPVPDEFEEVYGLWKARFLSVRAASRRLGVSHHTFERWVRERQACAPDSAGDEKTA